MASKDSNGATVVRGAECNALCKNATYSHIKVTWS